VIAATSSCQSVIPPTCIEVKCSERQNPASSELTLFGERLPVQGRFQPLPGNNKMLIMTEDGKRTIHDDLILCMDRPQTVGSHLVVTLYLLTGERIVGVVERREQEEFESLSIH